MSFPYTAGIPNPPNDPSVDVPVMQTNCNTINTWTQTDHIGFNNSQGGQHKQVTYSSNNASPSPGSGVAIETSNTGVASSASQLFYTNANATFNISPIAAWGYFTSGATTTTQGWNIAKSGGVYTIVRNAAGIYTVTLAAGATTGSTFGIIATSSLSGSTQTSINAFEMGMNPGVFRVIIASVTNSPVQVDAAWSFIVLQN